MMVFLLFKGNIAVSDATIVRYSSEYDQKLDPFTSFSKKERMRKYMDLRPYDKITLGMVGNKLKLLFLLTALLTILNIMKVIIYFKATKCHLIYSWLAAKLNLFHMPAH